MRQLKAKLNTWKLDMLNHRFEYPNVTEITQIRHRQTHDNFIDDLPTDVFPREDLAEQMGQLVFLFPEVQNVIAVDFVAKQVVRQQSPGPSDTPAA